MTEMGWVADEENGRWRILGAVISGGCARQWKDWAGDCVSRLRIMVVSRRGRRGMIVARKLEEGRHTTP